jgi:hypothetical protein
MEENQKHSGTREQRRSPRTENINLVDYAVFDDKGKAMDQGKGRTLNLCQNGMLLETLKPLKGVFIILTIDLNGKGVKVKGRLIYSNLQKNTGHYFSGIDFIGPKDQQVAAIVAFIKSYSRNKSKGNIPELSDNPIIGE